MKQSENILVLGLGGVGDFLARRLTHEGHHVTVIEQSEEKLLRADAELDARLIRGDATSFVPWHEANAAKMDYMIAVTDDDALNITAALIASKLGIEQKIARVRSMELWSDKAIITAKDLKIDLVIRPEELAAQEIARLVKLTAGNVLVDIADDLQVIATTVSKDSAMVGLSLRELAEKYDAFPFRVVSIARDIDTLIPGGAFRIAANDHLYIITNRRHIPGMMEILGLSEQIRQRVLIIGGGLIGERVAQLLQRTYSVRLIERDEARAEVLEHKLRRTEVLHGDGSSRETLLQAGLLHMDTIIAATSDNETNIMTSVLAKHLIETRADDEHRQSGKTIALVWKEEYIALASAMGTDVVVDAKVLAANEILRYVRRGHVLSMAHLHGCDAEVVELLAAEKSAITRKPLHSLPELHSRITIGAVNRGDEGWEVARGVTQIEAGDRVVCVCCEEHLGELQRLFLA